MGRYTKEDFSNDVKSITNPNLNKTKVMGRYDAKTKIRLQDDILTIRNLKESDLKAKESTRDLIHRVTLDEDKRPDLIALNFYGDARLYWIILGANDLREKEELRKDMLVRIPAKDSVYGVDGILTN